MGLEECPDLEGIETGFGLGLAPPQHQPRLEECPDLEGIET